MIFELKYHWTIEPQSWKSRKLITPPPAKVGMFYRAFVSVC